MNKDYTGQPIEEYAPDLNMGLTTIRWFMSHKILNMISYVAMTTFTMGETISLPPKLATNGLEAEGQ